ncbi:MAG TPA: M56 family metallopeptidase, partial [Gemmatimonadaceae bacterium]|nr:M56 family metallopeptidase [Gemmatimonadaceae bacterium]
MIVAWILYCLGCAAGLAAAAAIAERALLAGHVPVRGVWTGAVALSLLIPAAAFQLARSQRDAHSNMSVTQTPLVAAALDSLQGNDLPPVAVAAAPAASPSWRARLSKWDGPLAGAWVALSAALALYFGAGVVALFTMRRRWRREILLGVDVLVSERTGPALVGTLSPAIVLPRWTLAMDDHHLSLMLRHEQEHRRAGDGRLLTAAQVALVLMPWNAAIWWQIVRLRMAVELDCDARVLRSADARSYGDLLLEVARPRAGLRLVGVTAFAERATQLERRIRLMRRRRNGLSRAARAGVAAIGVVVLSTAWVAPRPPVPPRTIARVADAPATLRSLSVSDTIPHLALANANLRSKNSG